MKNIQSGSHACFLVEVDTINEVYIISFIIRENMVGSVIGKRFCKIIEGLCPISLLSYNQKDDQIIMTLSCELANQDYVSLIQAAKHAIIKSLESQQFVLLPKTL
jgi:hypothetical protein